MTTFLTIVIAVPMAIVVIRTKLPGGRLIALSMQWPFFISSLILGFGWILMYGPAGFVSVSFADVFGGVPWNLYSIPGMAVTEAVALAPIAYVFCANALRQSDASLESAAQVCGAGPLRILTQVIVPMLRPPVVYSSILVFSMSVETLSVPLLYGQPVGINVFSTFLYRNGLQSIDPDYTVLGAASTIILVVTVSLVALQAKLLKDAARFVSVRGKATRPRQLDLGWLKWVSIVLIAFYVVFGALVPIIGLIFRSVTLIFTPLRNPFDFLTSENYETVFAFDSYVQSIINSIIVAGVGSVLVSVVAVLAVMVARRSTFRYGRAVEYLALIPQSIPGIIIGIGFFWAFAYAPFGVGDLLTGTLAALIIAFGLRALPSAFGSVAPAIMQIGAELDNAARVSGADWLMTFFRVLRVLDHPGLRGRADPDLRDHAQGVLARRVPELGRQQRPRHHDARAVGPGADRLGRRARHHPDRHHRDVRRPRRPADERKAPCLSSSSPTSRSSSATTSSCTTTASRSATGSSSRSSDPVAVASPPP